MPAERNAVKLGTTLIVVLVLFLIIMVWLPQTLTAGAMQELRVRFPQSLPLPTLQKGSKVLVAGTPAGYVTGVDLERMAIKPGEPGSGEELYLVVSAKIEKAVAPRKDCVIKAVGDVLGGGGSLTLDVGTAAEPVDLKAILDGAAPGGFGAYLEMLGRELDASNPRSMLGMVKTQLDADKTGSIMAKLQTSMNDLNAITRSVSTQLDPAQQRSLMAKLSQTMDEINATTGTLRQQFEAGRGDSVLARIMAALDTLNGGLRSAAAILDENRRPIGETVQHVASAAGKLDTRIIDPIAEQLDVRNTAGLMAKINVAMDDVNKSLKDINVVTDTTKTIIVLQRENISQMILNLKQMSDHLKSAAKYILAHPWRLLKEPGVTETKQQAIFDAARNFAEAAASLDDVSSQLKALNDLYSGQIPANDPDLPRIRAELQTTFQKFKEAEGALWKQLNVR
jgi:ABC-type transporter Mla subunit MlaD